MGGACFINQVKVAEAIGSDEYPHGLPVIRWLRAQGGLTLTGGTTFVVGENGAGKSTLIEAIAQAANLNAEGGSRNFRFTSRSSADPGPALVELRWGTSKPRDSYFLRAESYYNVATEIERLDGDAGQPGLISSAYGGISPHNQSHGESFLNLFAHRFGRRGLYLLDEPEAALSPQSCLAALSRMAELENEGCQLIVATHSPILLALPDAAILQIEDGAIAEVHYDDATPVRLMRDFLASPQRFVRHLV
jgi:predicted ATPase